jgi:hypothetical protein
VEIVRQQSLDRGFDKAPLDELYCLETAAGGGKTKLSPLLYGIDKKLNCSVAEMREGRRGVLNIKPKRFLPLPPTQSADGADAAKVARLCRKHRPLKMTHRNRILYCMYSAQPILFSLSSKGKRSFSVS